MSRSYIHAPVAWPLVGESTNTAGNNPYGFAQSGCSSNVDRCTRHLDQQETASLDIQHHVLDDASPNQASCCDVSCGQVENMAACGVIVQDYANRGKNCDVGSRKVCTRPYSGMCPAFGDVSSVTNFLRHQTVFQTAACHINGNGTMSTSCGLSSSSAGHLNPYQVCAYSTEDFENATGADMQAVQAAWGDSRNYDEAMTTWCSAQVSGDCPVEPITGTLNDKCARLLQVGDDGRACRAWLDAKREDRWNYSDAVTARYCSRYNTAECKCYNRGADPTYQILKAGSPYNDGCWYVPCSTAYDYYLVPSDVDTRLNPNMCPKNFCVTYVNQSGYDSTYFNNNKAYINCKFDSP